MKYLLRTAKYFVSLFVLSTVLIALLYSVRMAAGTPVDLLNMLLYTPKGWAFLGAVALLSALYPRIGFMTAQIAGDIDSNREQIVEAFRTEGFVQIDEKEGAVTFRAASILRRLRLRFDDTITVRQNGSWIEIEGVRKVVARVEYRLEAYIKNNNE